MATWPPPRNDQPSRVLAWLDWHDQTFTTEHGDTLSYEGWQEAFDLPFAENLLVLYRGNLATSPLFDPALRAGYLSYAPRVGGLSGIRLRQGSKARWIVNAGAWLADGYWDLPVIREVWNQSGIGAYPTSSAAGQTIMRREYRGRRLFPLPRQAWELMKAELIGGRSDLFHGGKHAVMWEEDLNNAYAAAIAAGVPAGKCQRFHGTPPANLPWLGLVSWTPNRQQWPPVLPLRQEGATDWPEQGTQTTPLTQIEYQTAREAGYQLEVCGGWYWPEWSYGFAPWLEYVDNLRRATTGLQQAIVKQMIVAGIGRFGQDRYRWTIKPLSELDRVSDDRKVRGMTNMAAYPNLAEVLPCFAEGQDQDNNAELLPHVAAFVNARVRCWLWERMAAAGRENVLASNYDAVYLREPSGLAYGTAPGEWKLKQHHDVELPNRRWLISREVSKKPGVRAA